MTLHTSLLATTVLLLLTAGQAEAGSEKDCAKYKPDRTISSEASSDKSASASAKGTLFGGSASAESATAEKTEKQALSQEEVEKQEKVYRACLAFEDGVLEEEEWKAVLKESLGLSTAPPPKKKSLTERAKGALTGKLVTVPSKGKRKKKKPVSTGAQLKPAPGACGRFASMNIHVPTRYTKKSCKDDGNKTGRFLFNSTQGKAATCEHMRNWAGANGFTQVSSEMTRAKDTLVFSKGGFPSLTVKCVNTSKDSGKPTRLVFILGK